MYDIKSLIPQRAPIMMVDSLDRVEGDSCQTSLTIGSNNFFLDADGLLAEAGLVEHIAQSASAFAGYKAKEAGAENIPVGYIGEVKRFHCFRRPAAGEKLTTTITMGPTVGEVTILRGVTTSGGEKIADTQMKIAIKDE
jgi:predicted hotdog family 3-hydroxylacyl-ACP dehydratase